MTFRQIFTCESIASKAGAAVALISISEASSGRETTHGLKRIASGRYQEMFLGEDFSM